MYQMGLTDGGSLEAPFSGVGDDRQLASERAEGGHKQQPNPDDGLHLVKLHL